MLRKKAGFPLAREGKKNNNACLLDCLIAGCLAAWPIGSRQRARSLFREIDSI
jgi:hypothetical protein